MLQTSPGQLTVRQLTVNSTKSFYKLILTTSIAALTMTSIKEARHDLEHSVEIFLDCKSVITKALNSIEDCDSVISKSYCSIEETLRLQKQHFANALRPTVIKFMFGVTLMEKFDPIR